MGEIRMDDTALMLEEAQRAELIGWMAVKLKKEAGAGIKVAKKFGERELSFKTGFNGNFKLKNFGLGLALMWGTNLALSLASNGKEAMGFWGAVSSVFLFSAVGPALEGSRGAWRSARAEGLSPLPAFSRVCKRAGRGINSKMLPNPWTVGMVATVPLTMGLEKLHNVIKARAPGGKLDDISGRVTLRVAQGAQWTVEGYDRFGDWRFGQEVEGAKLEGAKEVGADIYAMVAKGWLAQRFFLADVDAKADSNLALVLDKMLGDEEKKIREDYKSLIKGGPKDNEGMLKQIRMAEAAGVDPWFKPAPGMPSMAEMASSFALWREAIEGADEALVHKVADWRAREEAQLIRAVVGEVVAAAGMHGEPRNPKRRL